MIGGIPWAIVAAALQSKEKQVSLTFHQCVVMACEDGDGYLISFPDFRFPEVQAWMRTKDLKASSPMATHLLNRILKETVEAGYKVPKPKSVFDIHKDLHDHGLVPAEVFLVCGSYTENI